jgi:hypothetical protein
MKRAPCLPGGGLWRTTPPAACRVCVFLDTRRSGLMVGFGEKWLAPQDCQAPFDFRNCRLQSCRSGPPWMVSNMPPISAVRAPAIGPFQSSDHPGNRHTDDRSGSTPGIGLRAFEEALLQTGRSPHRAMWLLARRPLAGTGTHSGQPSRCDGWRTRCASPLPSSWRCGARRSISPDRRRRSGGAAPQHAHVRWRTDRRSLGA